MTTAQTPFAPRHLGSASGAELQEMLNVVGFSSLD